MITAQDIREKSFDKATFGGYDMSGVDDYLEELAADATSTQKEISTLRAKMKVLVDKIEEYRANESAMNKAILAAQKLAGDIEAEAQEKADAILAEANTQADGILAQAQEKADALLADAQAQYDALTSDLVNVRALEERRLEAAKEAGAAYFEKAFADLERQKEFLTAIRDMKTEEPAAAEEIAVEEETVEEPAAEEFPEYEETVEEIAEETVEELAEEIAEEIAEEEPQTDDEVDEPTRMFRF